MTIWLYMFLNFTIIDAVTGFLPMSFVPFFLLTWVIINVASTVYPLQLTAGFYHWMIALPAYNTYNTLADIWSGGCNPILYRTLPILFAWTVLGVLAANVGMYRRCRVAAQAMAKEEEALNEKIAQARAERTGSASLQEKDDSSEGVQSSEYPEEIRQELSRYGVRMPFADTVEGMLQRRKTTA